MKNLEFWKIGDDISVRDAFGRVLIHAASMRDDFVLFDADVAGGTGAKPFTQSHPDRVIQFGIAEQNMMAAAAGFADTGMTPIVSTFAAFGTMRSHEQFRTACAFAGRNVKLCCSHHGIDVGPDGPTAQALEDIATMRAIPDVTVISPADANEFMQAFHVMLDHKGPLYMRIGRSPTPVITPPNNQFKIGKAYRIKEGRDLTIIATGVMVPRSLEAAKELEKEGISTRVVNLSTIKPLDKAEVIAAAQETGHIVTAEDHNIMGGMGSAVAEFIVENCPIPMKFVGVRDVFGTSGEHDNLPALMGIASEDVYRASKSLLSNPLLSKKGVENVA